MKFKKYHLIKFKITFYKTPLHLAVERQNIEIVRLLLKNKNININIKDEQGRKPIDYTTHNEIKQLLKG